MSKSLHRTKENLQKWMGNPRYMDSTQVRQAISILEENGVKATRYEAELGRRGLSKLDPWDASDLFENLPPKGDTTVETLIEEEVDKEHQ